MIFWYIKNYDVLNEPFNSKLCIQGLEKSEKSELTVFIEGYVIPRNSGYDRYKNILPGELVKKMYCEFGNNFVNHIKGIFTIIIIEGNTFKIFNDRHGIKKYFIFRRGERFFISNSLKLLSENIKLKIDKENIALFCLLSHHIDGHTIFKEVLSCRPAQILDYNGKNLTQFSYWHPSFLLRYPHRAPNQVSVFAERWKSIIGNYICYLKPYGISLTLTGGNDSRMVLAALLSAQKSFHAFTYGNPKSLDGFISRIIGEQREIGHANFFAHEPTEDWFSIQAMKIISSGNSLINIHRAHRNCAAECEKDKNPDSEMIITGLMGGEYLKEPIYGVSIPYIFKRVLSANSKKKVTKLIHNELKEIGIIAENLDIEKVADRLIKFLENGNGWTDKEKRFIYTYLFYGCAHHAQDSNVFGIHFKYVVNPFMDIDFLELLASDKKWYLNKSSSELSKIFHSFLSVGITDYLAPELSKIPYAKKGAYSADDLLRNKLRYILKRMNFYIKPGKKKYPPNFPMDKWLYNFCTSHLESFPSELTDIFNVSFLHETIERIKHEKTEESWHIVTNPINLKMNYEYFG